MIFNRMRISKCWSNDYYEFIRHPRQIRYSRWTHGFFSYLFLRERIGSKR